MQLYCREITQSILKEISPGCSLEGLMLKLKLQYFGHLMRRVDSLEKTLMLGRIGGRRRREWRGWDGWMASPMRQTWVWVNSGSLWWTGRPGVLRAIHGVAESDTTERLNWLTDWLILVMNSNSFPLFSCFHLTPCSCYFLRDLS